MNQQNWNDSASVGTQAVNSVHRFLSSDIASRHWKNVRLVYPVEENPFYQKKDIDLILIVKEGTTLEKTTIEVKGDRNDRTGNLFLETVSDVRRNTEGAFLVCEADWYFYFFVESAKATTVESAFTRPASLNNSPCGAFALAGLVPCIECI